ncbi:hypothetical protein [Ideonella margarita]|uniref:Uncharacterized protein n=1 Tax=Ideonella margarita TaxID=2984191 RepID=A0ABU9C446_9BURK
MMQYRLIKTAAGHAEIQSRSRPLSRSVRNLLLVINDSQPASYWLEKVQGVTDADLQHLLDEGLLGKATAGSAPAPSPAPSPSSSPAQGQATAPRPASSASPAPATPPAPPAPQALDPEVASLMDVVRATSYSVLYDTLNSQGKAELGLVGGFRFVLEVERCNGLSELIPLAQRFLVQVREERGLSALRRFELALNLAAKPA